MKKLLAITFLFSSLAVWAQLPFPGSTISLAFTNNLGQSDTNAAIIMNTVGSKPIRQADGSVRTRGPYIPCPIMPTNIPMAIGNYVISNAVLGQGILFHVPNDPSGTYKLGLVSDSGYDTYNYTPGVQQVVAGTNISITSTNGGGIYVINSTATPSGGNWSTNILGQLVPPVNNVTVPGSFLANNVQALSYAGNGSQLNPLSAGAIIGTITNSISSGNVAAGNLTGTNAAFFATGMNYPLISFGDMGLLIGNSSGSPTALITGAGVISADGSNLRNIPASALTAGGALPATDISRGTNFQKSQLGQLTNYLDVPENYFVSTAPTPPMGWNSWAQFSTSVTEANITGMIDNIYTNGYQAYGYRAVWLDDSWSTTMNSYGVLQADATRFPHGISYLANYAHSKGLKLFLYTELGTNTDSGTALGTREFYVTNAQTFASWGVDGVKYHGNWMTDAQTSWTWMQAFSRTLMDSGQPIFTYSINPQGSTAGMWRIDNAKTFGAWYPNFAGLPDNGTLANGLLNYSNFLGHVDQAATYRSFGSPGHYIMLDTLVAAFNVREQMTMCAILSSPMIWSSFYAPVLNLQLNSDVIAVHQDRACIPGWVVSQVTVTNGGTVYTNGQVWVKPLRDGGKAVALLNRTNAATTLSFSLADIGLPPVASTLYDLWGGTNAGYMTNGSWSMSVPATNVVFYKVTTGYNTSGANVGTTVWLPAKAWDADSGCTLLNQQNQSSSPVLGTSGYQISDTAAAQYIYLTVPGNITNVTGTIYCSASVANQWTIGFQGFSTPPGALGRWTVYDGSGNPSNVVVAANALVAVPFTVNFDSLSPGHESDLQQIRMVVNTPTNSTTGNRFILGPAKLVCQ